MNMIFRTFLRNYKYTKIQ